MRKLRSLLALSLVAATLASCVSSKKIIYFQGSDEKFATPQEVVQKYEMRLKSADQIMVKVTCSEPELLEIFNLDVVMGSGARSGSSTLSSAGTGSMGSIYGFTVDNEGYVTLPVIDRVRVVGLTCDQAAEAIEAHIKSKNIINDPQVTVRMLNARVSVVGAVKSPRVVSLTSERNTVLDVLAQCGDVSDQALRQRVTLYRETDGKLSMYHLDLTQADIFDNPAFYVQQNDLIYVQPNKSQNVRSSAFSTFLSTGASILGVISSIVALVIALSK